MLSVQVKYQHAYSRKELLLRVFFGVIYIYIPHFFMVAFAILWGFVLMAYSAFYILLKGRFPEYPFNYLVGIIHWLTRIHLSAYNLRDGYPAFGVFSKSKGVEFTISYNEAPNRFWVLIRFLVGPILILPHVVVWTLWNLWSLVLTFLAFWVVLFTRKYPKTWFDFNISTLRWILHVLAYQFLLIEEYPSFFGKK